jgi:D-alanyl-lipoteichoic acid acyltransferase DltB (MBOAT superfamily)
MLFHTWTFLVFFMIFYPLYRLLKGGRLEMGLLVLASYIFYGWWNPLYLVLIVYGTLADYLIVVGMERSPTRRIKKWWLAASVVSNIGILAFFKYAGFIATNVNALFDSLGITALRLPPASDILPLDKAAVWINGYLATWGLGDYYTLPVTGVLLPVGISFFTFQSMSYIIDCYRGTIQRERSLIRYAAYVSLFTQLVAGPIERASNLLRQLREDRRIAWLDVTDGLSLFVVGFFKKVALADYLSMYVDKIYAAPGQHSASALLAATFAFAWQIYFDFAGYTDMARGIARMMGLRLMLNFNNPYLADGLGDFWARWHISLSTWFKDYVYIPLGGNRKGTARTYLNMFLTMMISGLWHGAAWTFVIWGLLHGTGRVLTRAMEGTHVYRERVPRFAKQLFVFTFVLLTWVFFRARTVEDAKLILRRIFTDGWTDPAMPMLALGMVLLVWMYQFFYESKARPLLELSPVRVGIVVLAVVYLATFAAPSTKAFIYFQF